MTEEMELKTPHIRLAALAWGPQAAPPVMALHGWLDNAASFAPLAVHLEDTRLVALDLAGHGRSGHRSPGAFYHLVDYVWDVVAAAAALGWDRFSLLGHSLGAGIASFVAAVVPDRVERLALIEGLGPLAGEAEDGPANHARAIRQMSTLGTRSAPSYASVEEAARARAGAGDLSEEASLVLARRGLRASDAGFRWRSDRRLRFKSAHYFSEEQVRAYLRNIRAPVCLVIAGDGELQRRLRLRERSACVQNLEVVEIAGGHHLHMDSPASVGAALNRFLS